MIQMEVDPVTKTEKRTGYIESSVLELDWDTRLVFRTYLSGYECGEEQPGERARTMCFKFY